MSQGMASIHSRDVVLGRDSAVSLIGNAEMYSVLLSYGWGYRDISRNTGMFDGKYVKKEPIFKHLFC